MTNYQAKLSCFMRVALFFLVSQTWAYAATSASGYIYEGPDPISIRVVVIMTRNVPPYEGYEALSWNVEVKPQTAFKSTTSFLPITRDEYQKIVTEYEKKGRVLPYYNFLLTGQILRADGKTIAARWNRKMELPNGFSLRNGDVVQIYEVVF